jgi:hypothetical protein
MHLPWGGLHARFQHENNQMSYTNGLGKNVNEMDVRV